MTTTPQPTLRPSQYKPVPPRYASYAYEYVNGIWQKYQTQPYVPDTEAETGTYQRVKPGQIYVDGKLVPDPAEWSTECEMKVSLDPRKLLILPQPWIILQGYWPLDDHDFSLRIIPARQLAFIRLKTLMHGCRDKLSYRVPWEIGRHLIMYAPGIAYKFRFVKRDDTKRAWLIDYMPEHNHWQAETEFPDHTDHTAACDLSDLVGRVPEWAIDNETNTEAYYTRSYATPRSFAEYRRLMAEAEEYGSQEEYEPGNDDFQWVAK